MADTKIDKIQEDVTEIKVTQAKILVSLEEHIRRTEIAEERIEMLQTEIQPLKEQNIVVKTIWKVVYYTVAFIGGLLSTGIISSIISAIKKIN